MKSMSVLDDSLSKTMSEAQMMCHFVDSHPVIIQNHFLCSGCELDPHDHFLTACACEQIQFSAQSHSSVRKLFPA
jgi:hypothetical protein